MTTNTPIEMQAIIDDATLARADITNYLNHTPRPHREPTARERYDAEPAESRAAAHGEWLRDTNQRH